MTLPFSVKSVTWREWLGLAAGLLALGSLSALAGGHTHAAAGHASGAGRPPSVHFFCRLL